MNTARIVVLTIAIGAGGIAAYPASGSDNMPAAPAEPTAQLQTVDVLVAKADIGLGPDSSDQANKRGESINVVRYGEVSPQTMPKWPKGRTI